MIVSRYILLYTTTYLFNVIVIQLTESGIDALFKITKSWLISRFNHKSVNLCGNFMINGPQRH